MDYQGQKLCEYLYCIIVLICSIIGFLWGYIVESFQITLYWAITGFILSIIICLPDWPIYNRHPLHWQIPISTTESLSLSDSNNSNNNSTNSNKTKSS